MVKIQAHTMLPATPQRTALARCTAADADDGAGDGVRGRDRDAQRRGQEQGQRAAGFGAEAADRLAAW